MKLFLPGLALFAAAGLAFAADPVEVTTPELRGAVQPQLALDPNGRVHVVFGKENAIYHTASPDGRVFSRPVLVGELDKLALKMRRGPRVSATAERILVTAISHADGHVHAWTSTDQGRTFRKERPVNTAPLSAREGLQALAGDGRGNVALAWLDDRRGTMQVWARFSRDGGATWGDERLVYGAPNGPICQCCHPSVAFAPNGEIAIMWRNALAGSRDMHFATTRDFGVSVSAARKLGQGTWKLDACPMDGGGLAATKDGKWIAAWRRDATLYAHELGAPERPFAQGARQPVIAAADEGQVLAWEQEGKVMLLPPGATTPSTVAEKGASPCVAAAGNRVMLAWESGPGGAAGLFVKDVSP